jgi:hypothetical protein
MKEFKPEPPPKVTTLPSVQEMREAIEKKGITLEGTVTEGKELNKLMTLLYRNSDIFATCLKDLVGMDIIQYDIDIGYHPPIRQKQYRFAKTERDEIDRQIQELVDADILRPNSSAWRNSIFHVKRKWVFDAESKLRLVLDAKRINKISKHTFTNYIHSTRSWITYLRHAQKYGAPLI